MVLFERFDADALLDTIDPQQCSWRIGVPHMYAALVESQRTRPRPVDALRFCVVAGDVCPLARAAAGLRQYVWRSASLILGSMETFGTFTFGLQPGPVSRPAPRTQFRLVDDNGAPTPRGGVGELLVRGPASLSVIGQGRVRSAPRPAAGSTQVISCKKEKTTSSSSSLARKI